MGYTLYAPRAYAPKKKRSLIIAFQEMPDIFKLFNEHTRKSPEKKKEAPSR